MSVCAIMLVRDEADIIEPLLEHLSTQVDAIMVADNGSTDGTREIVVTSPYVTVAIDDTEVGYWQSRKMTHLAQAALVAGHTWVVPVDADEVWYAHDMTVRDLLVSTTPDVQIVKAELYNHLPTDEDDRSETNPIRRLGWRIREAGRLPKVACRLREDLVIEAGNHGARYKWGPSFKGDGLLIRHFSWRSPEQYLRKIRNGEEAYAATDLPATTGAHWRAFAGKSDAAILDHFDHWFVSKDPGSDPALIFDPAPVG